MYKKTSRIYGVYIGPRAVLGEYRPEVLTVRTERSEVRTKET